MSRARVCEAVVTYKRTESKLPTKALTNSNDVAELLRLILPDGPQERFVAIALDARNRPTAWSTVAIGAEAACPVSISSCFRWAILAGAIGVIFAHNHPSGECTPSEDDNAITKRLVEAGKLLGIPVLDHVILGYDTHYSYLDGGRL